MSVMMGMRLTVDPARFEQVAREDSDAIRAIAERAKSLGAIHHAFFAGDGEVLIADEWETEEGFHEFFAAASSEIGSLMSQAGVTNVPRPEFWRMLDTPDRF